MNELEVGNFNKEDYEKVLQNNHVNSPLLAKILASRGIIEDHQIDSFLHPSLYRDWQNPYDLEGIEEAANIVESAIKNNKNILIYGDYDVDGVTAVAVMIKTLKILANSFGSTSKFDYFLPSRFDEGYGFTQASVNRMLAEKPNIDLLISVDCGITSNNELAFIRDRGIEIVVTDHHEKSENFPNDFCVVDPKVLNPDSDSSNLCGVGVALKLICALSSRFGMPYLWEDYIDFAMLGTLADIMPLRNENRSIVAEGIRMINTKPKTCIKALIDVAGKNEHKFSSQDILWIITPRLNSAGRLNKPQLAVELLLCENYTEAYNYAIQIEDCNNQRKLICEKVLSEAYTKAKNICDNSPKIRSLVLFDNNWHPGVLGIVAAKIAETFHRPTIVFTLANNKASGSGRSYAQLDLHIACQNSFDRYIKFGGHKSACGLTIEVKDLECFATNFEIYMQNQDSSLFIKKTFADLEIGLHELTIQNVLDLNKLEPYGQSNEEPVFLTTNVFIRRSKAVGSCKNHLSCFITDGAYGSSAIMFNVDNISQYFNYEGVVFAFFHARISTFQMKTTMKMYLSNLFPSTHFTNKEPHNLKNSEFIEEIFQHSQTSGNRISSVGSFISENLNSYNQDIIKENTRRFFHKINIEKKEKNTSWKENINNLQEEIVSSMIGKGASLHNSQQACLDILAKGKSALAVMPTGRGKSLIFQVFAAMQAIKESKMSLFVYPLRALISDQAYHLQSAFESFGMNIRVLNGETPSQERIKIYHQMSNKTVDIILTTPEYLAIHCDDIAKSGDIAFLVIDECHHLGEVRIGQRTAYGHLPHILKKLKHPQVLALSATVSNDVLSQIKNYLVIDEIITDDYERENLFIDDRRNMKSRDDYISTIAASGQKTAVYVNSRQQTIDLARMIRAKAPHIAMKVGFYNAGLTKEQRSKIEQMFRNNELSVLIATSAFGEGVNIPDIRHVCLYHLPFSAIEFNQMAGRCGRDNKPAIVHLLYNRADATINNQILEMTNPNRDILAKIFLWIKSSVKNFGNKLILDNDNLLEMLNSNLLPAQIASIYCAIDIFNELNIINVENRFENSKTITEISLPDNSSKVNLEDSTRFIEGLNEINTFNNYRLTAMRKSAEELTKMLRHPIMPLI